MQFRAKIKNRDILEKYHVKKYTKIVYITYITDFLNISRAIFFENK